MRKVAERPRASSCVLDNVSVRRNVFGEVKTVVARECDGSPETADAQSSSCRLPAEYGRTYAATEKD